jgi:hypothetical protein
LEIPELLLAIQQADQRFVVIAVALLTLDG